ncbi:beta-galactosidase trimerization domain-containing protein, partial [Actinocorallia lasiicapitis]
GPLRALLGVRVEEPWPIPDGRTQPLDDGTAATLWSEWITPDAAETLARYSGGPLDGRAAITRHGRATYLSCLPDDLSPTLDPVLTRAGLNTGLLPEGVETCRRGGHLFLLNHGDEPRLVATPHGPVALPARDAVVIPRGES